ncbi:hypothetical protein [Azospirillum isscasi]|uniref:Uncharacterized protein n=1 Tax=Azospirillum isscasi TaxID=3053926 RepID=A0ABU0WF96_9PROT|nr:hypothetical protein [Azospirillum isscasi]MDQ2102883.1 hypothetical protein [Azospirillum isscasi]
MTSPDFSPLGDDPLGIRSQGASDAGGPPTPSKDGSETVRRRNTSVRGIVASLKNGVAMPWRWDAERDFMHLLEVDPDVLSYQRHQKPVALIIGHRVRQHTVDFKLELIDAHQVRSALVDIVGDTSTPERDARTRALSTYYTARGTHYGTVSVTEIRFQPRLDNAKEVLTGRSVEPPEERTGFIWTPWNASCRFDG